RRRELVHAPYHAKLLELLQTKIARFGHAVLIDAHSVASRANQVHAALKDDIYLGDRDGTSNSGWLTDIVERSFREQQLKVVRNNPYKGGYITQHYGRMEEVDALQIEMRWGLYMDEENPAGALQHPNFTRMKSVLKHVCGAVVTAARAQLKF
ncbi:MAG TPA: N-formylglutamate amidohydrolase, partial [Gammaproteobacteria bacterium]|nr:N-formylglutamate amidohydrolase [Gammaproteobacteria bacterium]